VLFKVTMTGHGQEYVPPKYDGVGKNLSIRSAFRPLWPFVVGAGVAAVIFIKIYRSGYDNEEAHRKSSKFLLRKPFSKDPLHERDDSAEIMFYYQIDMLSFIFHRIRESSSSLE
jgi:hypothetical protein